MNSNTGVNSAFDELRKSEFKKARDSEDEFQLKMLAPHRMLDKTDIIDDQKVKVLRRSGYGYTNQQSYLNKILQRCGYLNSRYINTNS